jgi:hypothetical protein
MAKSRSSGASVDAQANEAIQALAKIDITALSYVKLRRLNAVLIQSSEKLRIESVWRSENNVGGDTVRVPSPRFDAPR